DQFQGAFQASNGVRPKFPLKTVGVKSQIIIAADEHAIGKQACSGDNWARFGVSTEPGFAIQWKAEARQRLHDSSKFGHFISAPEVRHCIRRGAAKDPHLPKAGRCGAPTAVRLYLRAPSHCSVARAFYAALRHD